MGAYTLQLQTLGLPMCILLLWGWCGQTAGQATTLCLRSTRKSLTGRPATCGPSGPLYLPLLQELFPLKRVVAEVWWLSKMQRIKTYQGRRLPDVQGLHHKAACPGPCKEDACRGGSCAPPDSSRQTLAQTTASISYWWGCPRTCSTPWAETLMTTWMKMAMRTCEKKEGE